MSFTQRTSLNSPTAMSGNSYYNSHDYIGNYPFDSYYQKYEGGYIHLQCSEYVVARSAEIAGGRVIYWSGESSSVCKGGLPMLNRAGFGNGDEFYSRSLWSKTTLASEVQVGDIVCYGSAYGGGEGHVRIVEAITATSFICSSANENYNGACSFSVTISKANGGGASATGLQGYIHNPWVNEPEPTTYYTLSLSVNPEEGGYWTGTPAGRYESGTSISITAVANPGYEFEKIIGTYEYTDPHIERTMNKDRSYTAYFKKVKQKGAVLFLNYDGSDVTIR